MTPPRLLNNYPPGSVKRKPKACELRQNNTNVLDFGPKHRKHILLVSVMQCLSDSVTDQSRVQGIEFLSSHHFPLTVKTDTPNCSQPWVIGDSWVPKRWKTKPLNGSTGRVQPTLRGTSPEATKRIILTSTHTNIALLAPPHPDPQLVIHYKSFCISCSCLSFKLDLQVPPPEPGSPHPDRWEAQRNNTSTGAGGCSVRFRAPTPSGWAGASRGGDFGMTPWCDDLVCSWRRLLADCHSLPFPWTLSLHRRWCPSASHHPVTFLFLPALTVPLPCPFLSLGLSLRRPRCPSASHHSFPSHSLGRLCQRSPRTCPEGGMGGEGEIFFGFWGCFLNPLFCSEHLNLHKLGVKAPPTIHQKWGKWGGGFCAPVHTGQTHFWGVFGRNNQQCNNAPQ